MFPLNTLALVGVTGLGLVFAAIYRSLLTKLSRGLVSPYGRPDTRRRASAAIVDALIATSVCAAAVAQNSIPLFLASAAYVVLRDAVGGRSIGKFLFGLMVVNLETSKPASVVDSTARNLMFIIPGANVAAALLESRTLVHDAQGQRLGDHMARTHVVDGFGAKELAKQFEDLASGLTSVMGDSKERPREAPRRTRKAA